MELKYKNIRTRALRRNTNKRKALRKKRIVEECYYGGSYYDNLHEYSKGKIHCSCPMCRAKTNNKHRKGSLVPNYNPTIKEIKLNNSMDDKMKEFDDE